MKPIEMLLGFKVGAYAYDHSRTDSNFNVYCCDVNRNECEIVLPVSCFDRFERWFNGEGNVKTMLPELNAETRETLISGLTPSRQNEVFK